MEKTLDKMDEEWNGMTINLAVRTYRGWAHMVGGEEASKQY